MKTHTTVFRKRPDGEKKHSVIYEPKGGKTHVDPIATSIYVNKGFLQKPFPEILKITAEWE